MSNHTPSEDLLGGMRSDLAITAGALHQFQTRWDKSLGEPPKYIVGVTYLGLAHVARHLGFCCVEVPTGLFRRNVNKERLWDEVVADMRTAYLSSTTRGRNGLPLQIGVVSMTVDNFIQSFQG